MGLDNFLHIFETNSLFASFLIILEQRGLIFRFLAHFTRTLYSFFIRLCRAERNTNSQFDVDIEDYCSEGAGHQVGKYKTLFLIVRG